jgi:hypothetical protein
LRFPQRIKRNGKCLPGYFAAVRRKSFPFASRVRTTEATVLDELLDAEHHTGIVHLRDAQYARRDGVRDYARGRVALV